MKTLCNVFAALALMGTLMAAEPSRADDELRRIVVNGSGSAEIAPDMALLTLTVNREAATARAAVTENSKAMAEVIAAMRKLGVAERDLQTTAFSIQPRYTHVPRVSGSQQDTRKFVGYTVRNTLNVRLRDISKVGEALDQSVTLGVNEGGDIAFANDDPSAALEQARRQAVQDATARARTLAVAAGVTLGKVMEISEQSYYPVQPRPMMRAMAADSGEVAVAQGENSYQVSVNMSFAIEG
ncbi:MAG: SIMPL domain-containing protein [Halioglobus sp.]|nr:SIMPL domain-containing protein [Halioglobus sp.]